MNSPILCAALICLPSFASAALNFVRLGTIEPDRNSTRNTVVSADGTAATGWGSGVGGGQEGFHWTAATGMKGVGILSQQVKESYGHDISGNGSVVVGVSMSDSGLAAFRWTAATGIVNLGDLPGGRFYSSANGISADGTIIVGEGAGSTGNRAFKWTAATGLTAMAMLSGETHSRAFGISGDGRIIVGAMEHGVPPNLATQAVIWTPTSLLGIGDLPGGSVYAEAHSASWDGSAVSGWSASVNGLEAFRWTQSSGKMTGIGDLPGGAFSSKALSISSNGSRIVGVGTTAAGEEAFVWDEVGGMRSLKEIVVGGGLDLQGWHLTEASDISRDGDVIAGTAVDGRGQIQSFLISGFNSIPETSSATLIGLTGFLLAGWRGRKA